MSWVKLDDKMWCHPKFAGLSGEAVKLWVFGLCWCNQYETDGEIPKSMLPVLRSQIDATTELIGAGLWLDSAASWKIHDYLEYQPSKASKDESRGKTASRVASFRGKKSNAPVTPLHVECNADVTSAPYPARTRPVPDPVIADAALKTCQVDPKIAEPPQRPQQSLSKPNDPSPGDQPKWRPRTRAEALEAPIEQRAQWAIREEWAAAEYGPQDWPEVRQVATAFQKAFSLAPLKLGRLDSDKLGTHRIVSLLTQYTPDQLGKVCAALAKSKWALDKIGSGNRPRLGWLSDEVVRTQFAELPSEREISARVRALTAGLEPMREVGVG